MLGKGLVESIDCLVELHESVDGLVESVDGLAELVNILVDDLVESINVVVESVDLASEILGLAVDAGVVTEADSQLPVDDVALDGIELVAAPEKYSRIIKLKLQNGAALLVVLVVEACL